MSAVGTSLRSAVVGLETWIERLDGRVALEEAMYRGLPIALDPASKPELGALCDKLVSSALTDAGASVSGRQVLLGVDDAATPTVLQRVLSDREGLAFSAIGRGAAAFVESLKQADQLLESREADTIVILSVDLAAVAPRRRSGTALVVVRHDELPTTRRSYALLDALATVEEMGGSPASADDVRWVAELALGEAGVEGREIGYIELAETSATPTSYAEREGLSAALQSHEPTTALGGLLGPVASSISFSRALLALQGRYLPNASGLAKAGAEVELPFYLPDESRPFFAMTGRRRALVQITEGASTAAILLREHAPATPTLPRYQPISSMTLVPLVGDNSGALVNALDALDARLASGASVSALAAEFVAKASRQPGAKLAVALVGRDTDTLRAEIRVARGGVPTASDSGLDWQTPAGSTFSPNPQGRQGQVAFVYPGAFSGYVGLARDAFRLYPWLFEPGCGLPTDLGSTFAESLLYPRWLSTPSAEERAAAEGRFLSDHIAAFGASAASAVLYTRVIRDVFRVRPGIAFGYSLGEGSMFPALGAWNDPDLQRERLHASPLFRTRLGGSREALRGFWESRGVAVPPGDAPWATYVLRTSGEHVRTAIQNARNVFLTIVNTPDEVVIGGLPDECAKLVADLRCDHLLVPYAQLLHSEVVTSEQGEIGRLHSYPTRNVPSTAFYSATSQEPLVLERGELAKTIARMSRDPLDFPKLVDRVWRAGARVFVELGAGSSCSRLIAANLQGRPHMVVSMDRRGVDVERSVIRCLARLFTHRVDLDLSPLTTAGDAR